MALQVQFNEIKVSKHTQILAFLMKLTVNSKQHDI